MISINKVKTEIEGLDAEQLIKFFQELSSRIERIEKKIERHPEDIMMSRQEVADFFRITLPTLNSWTKKGFIPSYKIGSKVRFKKMEVLNALEKGVIKKIGKI